MLTRLLAAFFALSLATSACAQGKRPDTPEGWRAAAAEDLTAMHDILRDNSPAMLVDRDSAGFRRWLDQGLAEGRAKLPKVTDFDGYYFLLQGYVMGFRDSHIQWGPADGSFNIGMPAWPGFVLDWRDGRYLVAYRAPGFAAAPPLGAQLISCDGKSAEAIVSERDRYEGDLSDAGMRYYMAPLLLVDQANPFVARPSSCVFSLDGSALSYPMEWRPPDQTQLGEAFSFRHQRQTELDVQPWGDRRWWITVPSMGGGQDWNGFYAKIGSRLTELRTADTVVIDLRGNSGGDSSFGDRLLRLLWGNTMVEARMPDLGPTVWRATRLNRDSWARVAERTKQDPQMSADEKQEIAEVLSRYDHALAHGDQTFVMDDGPPQARPAPGANPMRAHVILLTDFACNSACLDLMDEATTLPNVARAGTTTSADTIFMELTQVPALPSGVASFAFGHKAWIRRPRGSNVPYTPPTPWTWRGDPSDDVGERRWLAATMAAEGEMIRAIR